MDEVNKMDHISSVRTILCDDSAHQRYFSEGLITCLPSYRLVAVGQQRWHTEHVVMQKAERTSNIMGRGKGEIVFHNLVFTVAPGLLPKDADFASTPKSGFVVGYFAEILWGYPQKKHISDDAHNATPVMHASVFVTPYHSVAATTKELEGVRTRR